MSTDDVDNDLILASKIEDRKSQEKALHELENKNELLRKIILGSNPECDHIPYTL
jgi:hypothetical protein